MLSLALLNAPYHVQAQSGGRLVAMRSAFEAALAESSVAGLKKHIADLDALEKKARDATDYETALAARKERLRVEGQLAAAEKALLLQETAATAKPVGKVVLKLEDATLEGVTLDSAKKVLTGWKSPASRAVWTLPGIPPGGYEVVLRYSSGAAEGGTVRVAEAFYTLTIPTRITLNGAEDHFLGTLRIRDGSGTLSISAATVLKTNLMELAAVELLPCSE